jgi:hypothetical protein
MDVNTNKGMFLNLAISSTFEASGANTDVILNAVSNEIYVVETKTNREMIDIGRIDWIDPSLTNWLETKALKRRMVKKVGTRPAWMEVRMVRMVVPWARRELVVRICWRR